MAGYRRRCVVMALNYGSADSGPEFGAYDLTTTGGPPKGVAGHRASRAANVLEWTGQLPDMVGI